MGGRVWEQATAKDHAGDRCDAGRRSSIAARVDGSVLRVKATGAALRRFEPLEHFLGVRGTVGLRDALAAASLQRDLLAEDYRALRNSVKTTQSIQKKHRRPVMMSASVVSSFGSMGDRNSKCRTRLK